MLRPHTLIVFVLLALVALFSSGCGDDKSSSAADGVVDPTVRLKTALSNAAKLKSGEFTLDATISGGSFPGALKITGGGTFDTAAKPAEADVNLSVDLGPTKQELGFVSVAGKNYVKFGDRAFEMKEGKTGGSSMTVDPKQVQSLINSLDEYVSDVKRDGTTQAAGKTLDVYTAKIDVDKIATDAENKNGGDLPSIPGLGNTKDLAKSVGETTVSIGIDDQDLPRSLALNTSFGGATGDADQGGLKATLLLTEINEPVEIKKPANIVEGQDAIQALGGLLGGISGQ
ncbi:MAG: hypothetical protein WAP35_04665 [Solirubrobacterales bacterium]